MTNEEIIKAVREVIRPYNDAETSQEFAAAQQAIRQWLDDNQVPALQTNYVPDVVHGLWLNETIAQGEEENMARLGLNDAEIKERRRIAKIVGAAHGTLIRSELDTARALMEDWFRRFPTADSASAWRTGLDAQQLYFDISNQIDAEAEMERAKSAIRSPQEKQLVGV